MFKQPRVPEYRENEGAAKHLRALTLFLKDFCQEVWTACRNADKAVKKAQDGVDGIKYPVTSVNKKTGDVVLKASDVGARADDWEPEVRKVYDRKNQNYIELTVSNNGVSFYNSVYGSRLYYQAINGLVTVYDADANVINRLYGTANKPTAADVGALPSGGTAANASKLDGNAPSYYMKDFGRWKTLWSGSWSSGTITVPNTRDYNIFKIAMSGQGTAVLAIRQGDHVRGIGGYSTATPSPNTYHFTATYSGNTWTFVACNNMNHQGSGSHSSINSQVVSSIVGVI